MYIYLFLYIVVCDSNEYLCEYEEKCIPASSRCNGIIDCQGGLDESDCGGMYL